MKNKKTLHLDYNIVRDVDRLQAIRTILDENPPSSFSPRTLEQMANYVLYGKDEKYLSVVDRKQIQIEDKKHGTFRKGDEKVQSLDAVLEQNPEQDVLPLERSIYKKVKQTIRRPKYDENGVLLEIGDGDIPGIEQLWDSIDRVADQLEETEDSYARYVLRHMLVDLRTHQYYLKDAYKPAIHWLKVSHPSVQFVNWSEDAGYDEKEEETNAPFWMKGAAEPHDRANTDRFAGPGAVDVAASNDVAAQNIGCGETKSTWTVPAPLLTGEKPPTQLVRPRAVPQKLPHRKIDTSLTPQQLSSPTYHLVQRQTFDYENPLHIRYLLDFYGDLYKQLWERPDTYGRALLFDLEYYVEKAKLTSLRYHLLERKVDRWSNPLIQQELREKFNIDYDVNHIGVILNEEIPAKIARAALEDRVWKEAKSNRKKCKRCGRLLPLHTLFFCQNASHKDGFASDCKECQRELRIARGQQSPVDRRRKENRQVEPQAVIQPIGEEQP